jgi:putative PIN family toxin of toxin-antitoxin system
MGKRKVTLDTNILISALGWNGNPRRILEKIARGELELFISHEQFNELLRVLDYERLGFTAEEKNKYKTLISELATFVKTPVKVDIIKNDPSDNRILECALVANVDYIVSGDQKHVLPVKKVGRIKVVTASELLKLLG